MRTLIAVAGCHARKGHADAIRATWGRDVRGADLRFFAGGWGEGFRDDDVWLDCPDSYEERRRKVEGILSFALGRGYGYLWRLDDDQYCRPERLLALPPRDYQGCAVDFKAGNVRACIGWIIGLSRRSMEILLSPDLRPYSAHEDVWIGQKLRDHGVLPHHMEGLVKCTHDHGVPNGWTNQEPPRTYNNVVASCEYTPDQMREVHEGFQRG